MERMTPIEQFQQVVRQLLDSIGFSLPGHAAGQDLYTLEIDERYTLHLSLHDRDTCLVQAELPDCQDTRAPLAAWLRLNAFDGGALQPVIALDRRNRPCCHLRIPLAAGKHARTAAFHALLALADRLDAAQPV